MTVEEAQTEAIISLLDVVEELSHKVGDSAWAEKVSLTFHSKRRQLRFPQRHFEETEA